MALTMGSVRKYSSITAKESLTKNYKNWIWVCQ